MDDIGMAILVDVQHLWGIHPALEFVMLQC